MTVASSTDRATFPGNGVTQIFPLPFRFFDNSEIQAWLVTNATGALTALTLGTHYTLSGAGDPEVDGNPTSELTMLTAPTSLQSLFVQRVIPLTQPTDIVNQGRFFPEIHENVFDRLTMLMQQVAGEAEGAIRVAIGDPEPTRLAPAVSRANQLMGFDSQGNPIAVAPVSGDASDLAINLANNTDPAKGAALLGWEGAKVSDVLRHSIKQYGTISGVDDSAAATAMIADLNMLIVPEGVTAAIKNIELFDDTEVIVEGALKLPDGSADFDRMIFAAGRTDISVTIKELDGNSAGQSGLIGTHLLYLTNCVAPLVKISHAHDHYYDVAAPAPSVDGIRDASTGAIFLYQCGRAQVDVGLLENWGREGLQLRECTHSSVALGHAQGSATGGEYSGLQVSGWNNKVLRASVDSAGASGVGFDTIHGELSNVLSTNTRENHGVNFGHTGFPASGSIASNIVVDGAFRHGISVGASTQDLGISGFTVKNAGELGLNASDGVLRLRASTGLVETCGQFNINAFAAEMQIRNTSYSELDARSIRVDSVTGLFVAGETVTASGGATGVVRKVLRNRAATTQILFLNSITGTWLATETVSGGTSGAAGTVGLVSTPTAKRELSGGLVVEESSFATGGLGSVTKFSDGTAIYRHTVAVAATAATLATVTTSFPSTIVWVGSAPHVSVDVVATSSTDAFNINRLSCTRTLADFSIKLNASVTQTYSVDVIAVGRWKL